MIELYHTLSRGVDKRKIFLDDYDYYRFVHNLYEFNDENWVDNSARFFNYKLKDIASPSVGKTEKRKRKLLVNIHIFCLMPNHYHLLLSPIIKDGIWKFMKKLNIGYAKYFNNKYNRSGTLFESRYKSIPILNESYFTHIPYYIHCNPLDLFSPEWRERKVKNPSGAISFLENYRWSSYLDYIGRKNFPSVTNRNFLSKFWGSARSYKKDTVEWIKDMELATIKSFILE